LVSKVSRGGVIARWVGIALVLATTVCGASAFAAGEDGEAESLPRYFTINEVLAKLNARAPSPGTNTPGVQLAALNAPPVTKPAAAPLPGAANVDSDEPFGLVTFRAPKGQLWDKWRKLEAELAQEARVLAQCQADVASCLNPVATKYLAMIVEARRLSGRAKIAWINRTINAAIRYTSDEDQYGVPDLWSAPLATLASEQGDCEDYAIAKFVALRDAGYSPDDLRLLIVRDRQARQDHAVVGVREDSHWIVLDNRHDVLLERKDVWFFTPLFALDQSGVKLFAVSYDKPPAGAPAQVAGGLSNSVVPASRELDGSSADATAGDTFGLRLDSFDPPQLRGGL
jgi:predicted transglutaminase-like cysteine proteinase